MRRIRTYLSLPCVVCSCWASGPVWWQNCTHGNYSIPPTTTPTTTVLLMLRSMRGWVLFFHYLLFFFFFGKCCDFMIPWETLLGAKVMTLFCCCDAEEKGDFEKYKCKPFPTTLIKLDHLGPRRGLTAEVWPTYTMPHTNPPPRANIPVLHWLRDT